MGLFSKLKGDKDKKNNRNSVHGHQLPPPGSASGPSNPSAGGSGAGLHPPSQPGPDHSSVSLVPPPHQEPPSSISQQQQQPLPQQQQPPWGYSPSPNPNPQAQGQQQFWPQQGQQYGGFPQAPYGQPIYILQNGQLVPVYTGQQIGVPQNVNMASPTVVSPITNADYGFQGNQSPAPVPFSSSSYQIPPLPVPPSAPPSGLAPSLYTTPPTIPSAPPSSNPYSHPENQAVSPVSPISDFSHSTAFLHHQPPSSTFTSAPVDPSATPPVVPKPVARKPVPGAGSSGTPISSTPPQLPLPTASVVTQGIGSLSVSDPPASSPEIPKQKVQLSPQMEQKVEFLKNQGNSMVEAKDYDQAIMFYSMALDYNPESAVCLSNRSMVYTQLHPPKMKEAKEDAEAATKADPSYWKGWSRLGDALLGMGEASRAVDAYNKAVEVGGASVGQNTKHSLANAKKAAGHSQSITTSPTTPVTTQAASSGTRTSTQQIPTQPSTPSLNTFFSTTSDTRATGANQIPRPAPTSTTATTSTSVASSSTATQPSRTQPPPVNTQTAPASRTPAAATATTTTATTTASGSSATPASPSASAPARTTQAASGLPAVLEEAVANVEEIGNSEAPPAYAPNPSSTDPTIRHMSQQAVYSQVIELRNTLLVRNKGSFVIKPYTAVGNIDAVRIEFVGMTTQELTPRELGVHPDQHPSFSGYFVNSVLYPGCTLIDLDMEVSKIGEGRLPGTYSVSGYSEVYRSQQLETAPILPITLSSVHTLPEVTVDQIVSRMTVLKYNRLLPETNMQMYESLRKFLGPDPYPNQTDADKANLRNQITDICYVLNRVDATKYVDMSNCRHLTNNTLGTVAQGIGLKNFLFQILLGCELLVRLLKEPANATYTGLISHNISANLVIADLWMQNIDTKRETTSAGLPRHLLISLVHQRQCEGLIRFAETFKWPYMDEARNYIEGAYNDLITGKAIGFDMCDWLFGLVRPGKLFRHLIMNCLVYSSPSIRDFQGAPTFTCGLVLLNRSYWPRRSVLGGVLGGLKNLTTVCGWVGPAPKAEGIAPGWCQVDARKVTIPVPCTKSQRTAEELEEAKIGPDGRVMNAEEQISDLADINQWAVPSFPSRSNPNDSTVTLKGIRLLLQQDQAVTSTLTPLKIYRAAVDFDISGTAVSYTLYSNPTFVTAHPCVGNHLAHRTETKAIRKTIIPAVDLKETYLQYNSLLVIDATLKGEEVLARAWCSERGCNAVVWRGDETCFACAALMTMSTNGLGFNVLIRSV
ncbi:hypothetical protein TWF788_003778 [Orbilia oligospora]|uniref:Uncharacterized protein n=1 Tax=Orbilia oligospora TaxID=2813651 RepID=A0A7C8K7E0_ORBOL|nr:hypothetical protein TWF788_003778 [Orbilia oligospora]